MVFRIILMAQKLLHDIGPLMQTRFRAPNLIENLNIMLPKFLTQKGYSEEHLQHALRVAFVVYRITGSEVLFLRAALMDEREKVKRQLGEFIAASTIDKKTKEQLGLLLSAAQLERLQTLTKLDRTYADIIAKNKSSHAPFLHSYESALWGLHGDDIIRAVAIGDILSFIDPLNNGKDPFIHLRRLYENAGKYLEPDGNLDRDTPYRYKEPILRVYRPMAQRSGFFYDRFHEVANYWLVESLGRYLAFISDSDTYVGIMRLMQESEKALVSVKKELERIFGNPISANMLAMRRILKDPEKSLQLSVKTPTSTVLKLMFDEDLRAKIAETGLDPTNPADFFGLMTDLVRFRGDLRDDATEKDMRTFLTLLQTEILSNTAGLITKYDYPKRGTEPTIKKINLNEPVNLGFVSLSVKRTLSGLPHSFIIEGQARLSKDIPMLEEGNACHEKKDALRYGGAQTEIISSDLLRRMGMRAQILSALDRQSNVLSPHNLIPIHVTICKDGERKRTIALYEGSLVADAVAISTNDVLRPHIVRIGGKNVGLSDRLKPNQEITIIVSDKDPLVFEGPRLLREVSSLSAQSQIAADLYTPDAGEISGTFTRKSRPPRQS